MTEDELDELDALRAMKRRAEAIVAGKADDVFGEVALYILTGEKRYAPPGQPGWDDRVREMKADD